MAVSVATSIASFRAPFWIGESVAQPAMVGAGLLAISAFGDAWELWSSVRTAGSRTLVPGRRWRVLALLGVLAVSCAATGWLLFRNDPLVQGMPEKRGDSYVVLNHGEREVTYQEYDDARRHESRVWMFRATVVASVATALVTLRCELVES